MLFNKLRQTTQRARSIGKIAHAARALKRSDADNRAAAQRALAALMADARGVPLKVGQLLGTLEKGQAFQELALGVPPQPIESITPTLERSLGKPISEVFSVFDASGIAASLGQVHKARLHTGEWVAVKVQYPDIADAVAAEMRLARLMPSAGPVRRWGFDLNGYKRMLHQDLEEELDYHGELERQRSFHEGLEVNGLIVPVVFPQFSSATVLVQLWEDGIPLEQIGYWPEPERQHVAVILICTLFQSLFVHGMIHGDPHAGNFRVRRNAQGKPEVALLDFGCVVKIPEMARLALLQLILGAIEQDETEPLRCYQAMGFDAAKLQPIRSVLPALTQVLVEPFTTPGNFPLPQWHLGERVDALLGELKWWFRAAGPPNLLLLIRAFHGLTTQLEQLRCSLPWQTIFFRMVSPELREQARNASLPTPPEQPDHDVLNFQSVARYLKVSVREGRHRVADVTLPAQQVAVLEDIIPEETLRRLRAGDIDMETIRTRACASGLVPQLLFEHQDGAKTYRVWLE